VLRTHTDIPMRGRALLASPTVGNDAEPVTVPYSASDASLAAFRPALGVRLALSRMDQSEEHKCIGEPSRTARRSLFFGQLGRRKGRRTLSREDLRGNTRLGHFHGRAIQEGSTKEAALYLRISLELSHDLNHATPPSSTTPATTDAESSSAEFEFGGRHDNRVQFSTSPRYYQDVRSTY